MKAGSSGRKQSELIRDAVNRLLAQERGRSWLKSLEPMFGMWADRPEMDHFVRDVREQADERLAGKWQPVKS